MTAFSRRTRMRFWLVTLATIVGILITASLGRWQLSRAAQKEALQSQLEERSRLPAINGAALLAAAAGAADDAAMLVHRPVELEGYWLAEHTRYLDNRQMQGRAGFFVLTPLQLAEPGGGVVLVQRGWAARNFQDRLQLPLVQTQQGVRVRIQGRVAPAPSRLYEFQGAQTSQGSSPIRQNLDLAAFRTETRLALASLTVLQTGAPSEGLLRDWPSVGTGVDKHYGYAFQWFGLCGLIALLYVWFQFVRRIVRPRSQPAP